MKTIYGLSISFLVCFGIYGVILSFRMKTSTKTLKNFIAATRSTGLFIISFAFYGPVLGTQGILIIVAQVGFLGGGWQSAASSTIYESLVPVVIALTGYYIIKSNKDLVSFIHFVRYRYGIATFIFTLLVMLFNMALLHLLEYLSIGSLFRVVVDPHGTIVKRPDVLIVVLTAGTVAIYTALGGLRVSLITDFGQSVGAFILLVMVVVYIAVKFRYPLTKENYETYMVGRNSIVGTSSWAANLWFLTMPVYDEGLWQRVWASKNTKTLILGSVIGGIQVGVMIFFMSALGAFSLWAGLPPLDAEGNMTLFTVFENDISSWIVIVLSLLLVLQSQSMIDSLQNGMLSTVLTTYVAIKELIQFRREKQIEKRGRDHDENRFSSQLENKFKKTSMEFPKFNDDPNSSRFMRAFKDFVNTFYKTLGARIVVIILQIILVPISFGNLSILVVASIQANITTMLFGAQFLGLFISPRYFKQIHSFACFCVSFIALHIYAHIVLKTSAPIPYSPRNVFVYAWNNVVNDLDWAIQVVILFAGLIACVFLTTINVVIDIFRGKLKMENFRRQVFTSNVTED